jgi:hypothetical protein
MTEKEKKEETKKIRELIVDEATGEIKIARQKSLIGVVNGKKIYKKT